MESAILHLADLIVHGLEMGNSGDGYVPSLDPQAWNRLGMTPAQIPQVVTQLDRQAEEFLPLML